MEERWNNLNIFNSVLVKAEEKKEAIQFYFQQLWQMDNLVILTGSGFTKYVDGPLMRDLSEMVLPKVIYAPLFAIPQDKLDTAFIKDWRSLWEIEDQLWEEIEVHISGQNSEFPKALVRYAASLNIENKISALQVVVSAFKALGHSTDVYTDALDQVKQAIVDRISSICPPIDENTFSEFSKKLRPYRDFMKRLIKHRRPQQPRIKIFTLNYDTVIETACDLEGITCITGFEGKSIRLLNPTVFDLDLSFRSTGQSSVHYPDVIHLYKLHGSIDWVLAEVDDIQEICQEKPRGNHSVVIYPCYTKFAETLELPYYEMFRRLGECISQPQTVVLILGYGFNDEHVNQMIRRAFKNPSCQFVVCEPATTDKSKPASALLKSFLEVAEPDNASAVTDPRVTILGGESAKFPEVLDIIFQPVQIESPNDQIRKLVKRLIEMGQG